MKTIIYLIAVVFNLILNVSLYAMQPGSLSFKNTLEHVLKIKYETNISGTYKGNTYQDNIVSRPASHNPDDWQQVAPQKTLCARTFLQVNEDCVWGPTVAVSIYQPSNKQVIHFIVSNVLAYSIISGDKSLVLCNDEQKITIHPEAKNY